MSTLEKCLSMGRKMLPYAVFCLNMVKKTQGVCESSGRVDFFWKKAVKNLLKHLPCPMRYYTVKSYANPATPNKGLPARRG